MTVADSCSVTGSANFVGGIAGRIAHDAQIDDCTVAAPVSGTYGIGGLAGCADLAKTGAGIRITDSTVSGNVAGSSDRVGGVVGQLYQFAAPTLSVTDCTVSGNVTGRDLVGGMVGGTTQSWVSLTITGGTVTGAVTGREMVAGVIAKATSATTVDGTAVSATVTGTKGDVGGVLATASAATTVTGVDSAATVSVETSTANSAFGGVIGAIRGVTATVENTRFSGSVDATNTDLVYAGGIVGSVVNGSSALVATDVLVSGNVSILTKGYVGGIAGGSMATGSVTVTRALVTGTVSAPDGNVGALVGRTDSSKSNRLIGTITDSYATDGACAGSVGIGQNGLMDKAEDESGVDLDNVKSLSANDLAGVHARMNAAELFSGDRWNAVVNALPELASFASGDATVTVELIDVAPYRINKDADGNYTDVPDGPAGTEFAGWFTDEGLTTPLGKDVTEGTAYAKFVHKDVLTVKYQQETIETKVDGKSKLRIVTTVDSREYRAVGFKLEYTSESAKVVEKDSAKAYAELIGYVDGEANPYAPTFFSNESFRFCAFKLVASDAKATTINGNGGIKVTPFWIKQDGTKVYGTEKTGFQFNILP